MSRKIISNNIKQINMKKIKNIVMYRKFELVWFLVILPFILYPLFLDIYRDMFFDALLRDDYAPYLLSILGEEGGKIPISPFVYRPLSVILAIPFYYLIPVFRFSHLDASIEIEYIKASQSLALVSYLSIILTSYFVYKISLQSKLNKGTALAASLLTLILFNYVHAYNGIDPIGILFITVFFYYSQNLLISSILLLFSIFLNEKIIIVVFLTFFLRSISDILAKRIDYRNVFLSATAFCCFLVYLLVRKFVAVPGNSNQLNVSTYIPSFFYQIEMMLSLKGLLTIVFPTVILIFMFLIARAHSRQIYISDPLIPIALFLVAIVSAVSFNTGRIVFYCFTIPLPYFVDWLILRLRNNESDNLEKSKKLGIAEITKKSR